MRPNALGYHESLRGFGGIVSPLLAGFSLAAIATILTTRRHDLPPLSSWAVAALTVAVAFLLFAMQTAILSLNQNSSPSDILSWRPEATTSEHELTAARAAQAADKREMERLGRLSFAAYPGGLIAFLLGLALLLVPRHWGAPSILAVAAAAAAGALEVWWLAATYLSWLPHPVLRNNSPSHETTWNSEPPALDAAGLAAVLGGRGLVVVGVGQARPTRADVDALWGAATPHFAYQLRARLRELVAGFPADDPVRAYAETKIELLDRLAHSTSKGESGYPESLA